MTKEEVNQLEDKIVGYGMTINHLKENIIILQKENQSLRHLLDECKDNLIRDISGDLAARIVAFLEKK